MPGQYDNHPAVIAAEERAAKIRADATTRLNTAEAVWQEANAEFTRMNRLAMRPVRIAYLEAELETLKAKEAEDGVAIRKKAASDL
jgi:hypothetical protein